MILCIPKGNILNTGGISVLSNDRKCKYSFMQRKHNCRTTKGNQYFKAIQATE